MEENRKNGNNEIPIDQVHIINKWYAAVHGLARKLHQRFSKKPTLNLRLPIDYLTRNYFY